MGARSDSKRTVQKAWPLDGVIGVPIAEEFPGERNYTLSHLVIVRMPVRRVKGEQAEAD
jgi:hypothetical protein